MHVITSENYGEALDAIRDILLMYVDMAESYEGFGHAVDVAIRFDPLKFLDATMSNGVSGVDLDLLRTGSAIAILCFFYDMWCEFEAVDVPHRSARQKEAVVTGRLGHVPDIEAVAREALRRNNMPLDDPWFDDAVKPIYQKHVLGYFRRLSQMTRQG